MGMHYLTTGEAARVCGVHVNTIKGWIRKGAFEAALMPGGHWRIPKRAFIGFLQKRNIPVPESLAGDGGPARILIIDDDPQVQDFVRGALESAPFASDIHTADDGYSALIRIGHLQPQLLVLDIMMPEINGLELIHRLRKEPGLAGDMRILVLTGAKDRRLVVQRLREARPDAILFKPVNVEQLLAAATRLLGKESTDPEEGDLSHATPE